MGLYVDVRSASSETTHRIVGRSSSLLPEATAPSPAAPPPTLDWARAATVVAHLEAATPQWSALERTFSEREPAHLETLLALSHEQRVSLAKHGSMATRLANAGYALLTQARWESAMLVYDAALEGPIQAGACANPLYAVQNDNNHLGVNEARARFYLARCLPHAPANPAIYLNAACVAVELGELEEALRLLELAKAAKVDLAPYRHEPLMAVLVGRPEFERLFA
jgi:tetratricopeptide (TPR) repeat protein